MTNTPDQTVTKKIIAELQTKQLVDEDRLGELEGKLSAGKVSTEDWRLIAELTIAKAKEGGNGEADRKTDLERLSGGHGSSRDRVRRK
jgi:hypothetical protein